MVLISLQGLAIKERRVITSMRLISNNYTLRARLFPAILTALPFFVIWYYLSENTDLNGLGSFLLNIRLFGIPGITFSIVFLYFYSLAIREVSLVFQRKYFTDPQATGFPTTYLMLYTDDALSSDYKDKYRETVSRMFHFGLLSQEQEEHDLVEAKKRLNEAAGLVRRHVKDGYLVLNHNIQFGFFRNFLGGTVISIILCIVGIPVGVAFLGSNRVMTFVLLILFGLYLVVFLYRKRILIHNAEAYAKQLFFEFIGDNG